MERYGKEGLAALLPWPDAEANKYSRGRLILFAGSSVYPGAACLAASASQQAGAGYTEVYTAPRAVQVVQVFRPSLVVRSWEGINHEELQATQQKRPCAYVVGPGFDLEKSSTASLTYIVLGKAKAPVLIDGGALSALNSAAGRTLCKNRVADGFPTIITPHAGEAEGLLVGTNVLFNDLPVVARELSARYSAVTVLKGPVTYVSDGYEVFALSQGTPALAKAGTGDVLAGIIGAFLAQGLDPFDAAILGTSLHAEAGCLAAAALTLLCVTAEDVIEYLPEAIRALAPARR
ncbi:MAG: NAD(P)H-hydrate dehydratase [Eggerthellaceae bacterium]|nr:NAD(P)H-hydrate dehydratase [Eggerthellaceae bacterium]